MRRTKKANTGQRRYPTGKYPQYDNAYNELLKRSSVISSDGYIMGGLGECRGTLQELIGFRDGYYKREGNWYAALIPTAQNQLEAVRKKWKKWQDKIVRTGMTLKPPTNWPPDLLAERLKAEAHLDVRHLEKVKVEARIKKLEAKDKEKQKEAILPHGPLGRTQGDKKIIAIDGQPVSYQDNRPFIDCADSPYDRMPVFNYRQMSKAWQKDMGITLPQLRERREELHLEACQKAVQEGKQPPTKRMSVTNAKVPKWMKRLGVTKSDWPEWPEDAVPVDELELEEV